MCAYKSKQAQISSSGEFSDSQGLDKFLNARDSRDEEKALNKAIPKSKLGQELSRAKQSGGDYGKKGLGLGNYRMGAMGGMGGLGGGASTYGQYNMGYGAHLDYDYDDSYGGGYQLEEEEEERDPYAFDIEIDTKPQAKSKGGREPSNNAKQPEKNQEDSKYEQRKAALQAKKDKKKQEKLEQERQEEEERKRQEEMKKAMSKRQTLDVADAYRDDSDSSQRKPETEYDDESKIEESSLNYEKQVKEYQKALKEIESMQKRKGSSYGDDSNRNASHYGKDSSHYGKDSSHYGRDSSNKFGESTTPLDRSVNNIKQGNAEINEDLSGSNYADNKINKQEVTSSIHSSVSQNYEPPKFEIYNVATTNEQLRKSGALVKDDPSPKRIAQSQENMNMNYLKSNPSNKELNQGSPDHLNLFLKDSPLKDHRENFNVTPIKPQDGTNIFNTDLKEAGDAYHMLNSHNQPYANKNMNIINDGRFGGVVLESLLRDEKRHGLMIEEELKIEQKRFNDMKRVADERERSMMEMELRLKAVKKDLEETREDLHKYEKRNVEYQIEVEDLVRQLDIKDAQVAGLMGDVENLKLEVEEKTRLLKEKREFYQRVHENRAIDEIKRQTEIEKDILILDNEKIKEELEYLREAFKKSEDSNASLKIALKQKVEADLQIRSLKQKLLETENKLKEKNEFSRKAQIRTNLVENFDELNEDEKAGLYIDFEKELEIQELLLKGYQKENEKLVLENKALRTKIEKSHEDVFNEKRNLDEIKNKLLKESGNYLISRRDPDVQTLNQLAGGVVVSENLLKEAESKILRLQDELMETKNLSKQRESEMRFELDRLRDGKKQAESKLAGVDMSKIKQDYSYYTTMEGNMNEKIRKLEAEKEDLRTKLNWYIENQENLGAIHEEIHQREAQIKELNATMEKLLNEPASAQEIKTKHFQNLMARDQKRIKELEKHIKSLEEGLQKKNPDHLKIVKEKQEENKKLVELKSRNKALAEELEAKAREYENKITELRQSYDKMRLEFERKLAEGGIKAGAFKQIDKENILTSAKDDTTQLRKRIQELEKELTEVKQYYLKKSKNLNKRQPERRPISQRGLKPSFSPPQQDRKPEERGETVEKKKDPHKRSAEKKGRNSRTPSPDKGKARETQEEERELERLLKFSSTEACRIYFEIWKEVEGIKHSSMKMSVSEMKSLSSNLLQEIDLNIQNKTLSPKEMDGAFEALRNLILTCQTAMEREDEAKETPAEAFNHFESTLRKRMWLNIIHTEYNPKLRANNFMSQGPEQSEANGEELIFKNMQVEREAQHLRGLVEALKKNISVLEKEKRELLQIIEKQPKHPRSANQEISLMEKKIEMLEHNYAQKELEINFFFKKMGQPHAIDQNEILKMRNYFEKEKSELMRVIEEKNKQISEYKIELSVSLREIESLRRN